LVRGDGCGCVAIYVHVCVFTFYDVCYMNWQKRDKWIPKLLGGSWEHNQQKKHVLTIAVAKIQPKGSDVLWSMDEVSSYHFP
jgi:hypothetical protein